MQKPRGGTSHGASLFHCPLSTTHCPLLLRSPPRLHLQLDLIAVPHHDHLDLAARLHQARGEEGVADRVRPAAVDREQAVALLQTAGKATTLQDAAEIARDALLSGKSGRLLDLYVEASNG